MGGEKSDTLLESFQTLECTQAAERQAVERLTRGSKSQPATRNDLQFALSLVNQINHLFSKRTAELRKLALSNTSNALDTGLARTLRVVLAAFRQLGRNRASLGFGALALEKTLGNFITACVNAHVGVRVAEGMWVLHGWLREYAETQGGRTVRKAVGARGARAAEGALAGGMRRLSIGVPAGGNAAAAGVSPGKHEKRTHTVPTSFPIKYYCAKDAGFNSLVAALLCNALRSLAHAGAQAQAQQTHDTLTSLTEPGDRALDWILRQRALDCETADMHLQACFRAYYALSSIASERALDLRLLALTAYGSTRACDARELLKYAARAGNPDNELVGWARFVDKVVVGLRKHVDGAAMSPELVEFVQAVADARRRSGDVDGAVAAWRMLEGRGETADVAGMLLARDTLLVAAMDENEAAEAQEKHAAALLQNNSAATASLEGVLSTARSTLATWNALALCGDRLRRTSRRTHTWLAQTTHPMPLHITLARAALTQTLAADLLYTAYVGRGAAHRAMQAGNGGSGSVASVRQAHGDACLTGVQLAVRVLEHSEDGLVRDAVRRVSARIMQLGKDDGGCGDGQQGGGLLRAHSTVLFNHAAGMYRLGGFARAAEAAELAIGSMAAYVDMAQGEAEAEAVAQLCKRYEVAASAYQSAGMLDAAAATLVRAAAFLSTHVHPRDVDMGGRPPCSTTWAAGSAVERLLRFVDRYVRLCFGRLQSDPEDTEALRGLQQQQKQKLGEVVRWSDEHVVRAWVYEAEADALRPLANAAGLAAPVQTARVALLEQALRLYAAQPACAAAAAVRCLLELGKAARDLDDHALAHRHLTEVTSAADADVDSDAGVLMAAAEAHAWLAIGDIEHGDATGRGHTLSSVRLWTQFSQTPPEDPGVCGRALDAMGAFCALLDARAVHGDQRLLLCRSGYRVALHRESRDTSAECVGAGVMWLTWLARECGRSGTDDGAEEAAELFALAAERCTLLGDLVPVHVRVMAATAYAEYLVCSSAGAGAGERAWEVLEHAACAVRQVDGIGGSGGRHARARGKRRAVDAEWLATVARASVVHSLVARHCGALADAVEYAVHAHRVVGALLQSLEAAAAAAAAEERRRRRQALRSAGQCEEDDPFGPPAAQDAEEEQVGGLAPAGDWMLQRLAADCLAQLAHVHSVRGSVREAEYFASRMLSVATERLCAPRLALRARRLLADILARRGALDECSVLLETVARDAEALEEEHAGGDLDGLLVEGDAWRRLGRVDQALARYERVAEHVHRLEACKEHGVVRVLARDVEVRRGLLSADQIKLQESNATTLADDQSGGRDADRVCEHLLLHATPAFDALWRAANLTRSGLGGAVLVPSLDAAGTSADRRPTRGRGAPQAAVYQMALNTYGVLRRVATLAVSSGTSHSVHASTRMLAVSAALMQAYGAASVSAGSGGGVSAAVVASVLDAPLNITVARETVEAMRRRTMVGAPPELTAWPADVLRGQGDRSEHSPDASPGLRPSKHVPSSPCMLLSSNDNDNDDDDGGLGSGRGENMDALRAKFFQDATDGARISALWPLDQTGSAQQHPGAQVSATLSDVLPREWVVCGVSVDSTRDVLLLTRYEHKRSPLVLILPLRAVSLDALDACVDGLVAEGGPVGAFQRVLAGLGEIIQASDRSMKSAPACVTPQDKRTWWERRAQLDKALGELLHRVQNAWFGLFCRLLCPEPLALPSAAVRDALQACVLAHVPRTYAARTRRLVVSDELCALVADAAARCVERAGHEWRDVCGLVWAVYCRRDAAPDLDARVLEEFSDALYDSLSPHVSDTLPQQQNVPMLLDSQTPARHLILALDKHAQQLPWEMLPCLADHPVSRVPSVSFLLDHLLTASKPITVDPTSVSYVLNPAGDLPRTQAVFEPLIKAHPAWQGIMGRTPSSGEFAHALSSSSIFMYLGHGGGEAYWSRARLRATRVRSVALLFGCSSAVMRLMGEYDAVGTPADYVVAGCRALLGNLWDVGDKDIDRFAVEVLRVWGVLGQSEPSDGRPVSLAEAVCLARKVCRMPFLTGAAPVVYGLPVYLSSTG